MSGRGLTTDFKAAVEASARRCAILIEAYFDSGTLRIWSGIGDLSWGGNTYTGSFGILDVQVPNETAETRAAGSQITLSGLSSSIIALADGEPYQGRKIIIRLALFDATEAVIATPDQVVGYIDVIEPQEEGATARVVLNTESRLVALERANERRWTSEDQKLRYAGDKGFDFVSAIQQAEIRWGPQ